MNMWMGQVIDLTKRIILVSVTSQLKSCPFTINNQLTHSAFLLREINLRNKYNRGKIHYEISGVINEILNRWNCLESYEFFTD